MPDELTPDMPTFCMPPTISSNGDDPSCLDDHPRSPTPDTPSTASDGMTTDQRDSRSYIPYDLRIFHPDTLFTTRESLERERAGTSANSTDPSQELRQALELERWTCYWLSMRLRHAKVENRELQVVNAKLEKYIEELKSDCEALREQLNIVAIEVSEIEGKGITNDSSSILRGVLRSRMVGRVSNAIRRASSPLAKSETRLQHEDMDAEN